MSDYADNTHILNTEAEQQLVIQRNIELYKVRKLKLVLNELHCMRLEDFKDKVGNSERLGLALKILSVGDYLHLNNGKDNAYLLDLGPLCAINLSYTERKFLEQQFSENLKTHLERVHKFGKKMRAELPDVFLHSSTDKISSEQQNVTNPVNPRTLPEQIIALETERRCNMEKLIKLRHHKCCLLKTAAELKTGTHIGDKLELSCTQSHLNQMKATVLNAYFIKFFLSRSEHSLKALKEIEEYINQKLKENEND